MLKSTISTHALHAERSRSTLISQHLWHLSTPLKVKDGAFGILHYCKMEFSVKHNLAKMDSGLSFCAERGE